MLGAQHGEAWRPVGSEEAAEARPKCALVGNDLYARLLVLSVPDLRYKWADDVAEALATSGVALPLAGRPSCGVRAGFLGVSVNDASSIPAAGAAPPWATLGGQSWADTSEAEVEPEVPTCVM